MPGLTGARSQGIIARIFLLILLVLSCAGTAPGAVFSADAVKAAFLYRFASYVEWPVANDSSSFVIAVSGADGVADQLEKLLPAITVRGKPAKVRRVARPSDLDGVHILYIGPDSLSRTRAMRQAASKLPILLVTEAPEGFDAGGIINFIEQNRNVRFEVSLAGADRARLRIDSALLAVAARVERSPVSQ